MDEARIVEIANWVTEAGLTGQSETALVDGFCERAVAAGIPLLQAILIIDTLHPIHEGRVCRWWRSAEKVTELIEYGSTSEGEAAENWRQSPFYRMLQTGEAK